MSDTSFRRRVSLHRANVVSAGNNSSRSDYFENTDQGDHPEEEEEEEEGAIDEDDKENERLEDEEKEEEGKISSRYRLRRLSVQRSVVCITV